VCACGFSIGFERIIAVLKDAGVAFLGEAEGQGGVAILVDAKASGEQRFEAVEAAQKLRAEGRMAAVLPMRKNMKRQIQTLEEQGYAEFQKVYAN
jgi:histidyl-tRNA synthetase